ncbi:MAG TPA: polysaccharide pyruvyl transferase family protein [Flavobacterium sp.]|nr:polysaccharide pyruvyl transferase family protein [Flavobacterium sp.]
MKNVLIIGSYNGQDSLGDKCLLRAVTFRFRKHLTKASNIIFHLNDPSEFSNELKDVPVTANQGLQTLYWNYNNQISRFKLNNSLTKKVSEITFPLAYHSLYKQYQKKIRTIADEQLNNCAFMFVFGGTNFSKQWWWLNIVPYMLTAKMYNLPVYFGTQQYGPMLPEQQKKTQKFMFSNVKDIRFRNPACFKELGYENAYDKLTRDEVFSNIEVYPNATIRSGLNKSKKTILINYRGTQDFLLENPEKEIEELGALMNKLGAKYDADFLFFSVSGSSFADDTEAISKLRKIVNAEHGFSTLPYTNEFDLIEKAKECFACVSMSFHGCILAMIGGCPAIPLSSGDYYDHKYISFEQYNPSMPIPVIYLNKASSDVEYSEIIRYFDQFEIDPIIKERERSNLLIDDYYRQILSNYDLLK